MLKYMLSGIVVMTASVYGSESSKPPVTTADPLRYIVTTTTDTGAPLRTWASVAAALAAGYGPLPHCGRAGKSEFLPPQDANCWKPRPQPIQHHTGKNEGV